MNKLLSRLEAYLSTAGGQLLHKRQEGEVEYICADLGIESIIQTGDDVKAGFAARIAGSSVEVLPYLFRELTQTGTVIPVMENAVFTKSDVADSSAWDPYWEGRMYALRTEAIPHAIQQYRLSLFQRMDENQIRRLAYQLVALSGSRGITRRFLQLVREEWKRPQARGRQDRGKDPRRFDVINGIMALAAEMPKDAMHWKLMQLAGTLIAETRERYGPVTGDLNTEARRHREELT